MTISSNSGLVFVVLLTGAVCFFLGGLIAQIFAYGEPKPLIDIVIAAVGAFAGTLAGAWIALSGDRKRREKETENSHVEFANIAIFHLSTIYGHLVDYENQIIRRHLQNPLRWFEISRSALEAPTLEPFNVERLAFLFEGRHKNLPNLLAINFVRYAAFLGVAQKASEINDEIQGDARYSAAPPEFPEEMFNPVAIQTLTRLVETMISHHKQLLPAVMEAALALRAALKEMYPERTIIQFAPEHSVAQAA